MADYKVSLGKNRPLSSGSKDELPERWQKALTKLKEQRGTIATAEEEPGERAEGQVDLKTVRQRFERGRPGGWKRAAGATVNILGESLGMGMSDIQKFYKSGMERKRMSEKRKRAAEQDTYGSYGSVEDTRIESRGGVTALRQHTYVDPFSHAMMEHESRPKPNFYADARRKHDEGIREVMSRRQSLHDSYFEQQRELMRRTDPFRKAMSDFDDRSGRYKSKRNAYAKYRE